MPRFYSTNRDLPDGFKGTVGFKEALRMGQAPDGGLFLPESLPRFEPERLAALKGRPFAETAFLIASEFLRDEFTAAEIRALTADAYDFPVPIEHVDLRTWVMRLDRGPTASFKDFAARLLARLLAVSSGGRLTILVATSGDTGSAVGEAFKGVPDTRVFILYPEREVSPNQKRQLDGIGANVAALAIDGKFDDCQALVKRAFSDRELSALNLTSANSINFGRILPQTFYYAHAWAQVTDPSAPLGAGSEIVFSIPSGNFGNAFGAELMRRMGLPIRRIILAVNGNDEFPRFLAGEPYCPVRPSRACLSNAMNVGHPSNLARFFDVYGGALGKDGDVRREPDRAFMRERLFSTSISDDETRRAMRRAYETFRTVLEPHGAVGWRGLEKYREATGDASAAVILETAHPAKFPEAVREVLGVDPELPDAMKDLHRLEGAALRMPNDYAALKEHLLSHA